MTLAPADLYHSGFLVEDLDATLERLDRLGYHHWTPPKEHSLPVRVGTRTETARFRYVYSAEGPHHLELIEPLGEGYLRADGPMVFHHLGHWVNDLEASIVTALDHGLDLECLFLDAAGDAKVAYLLDETGMRHELVPRQARATMEERWAQALRS